VSQSPAQLQSDIEIKYIVLIIVEMEVKMRFVPLVIVLLFVLLSMPLHTLQAHHVNDIPRIDKEKVLELMDKADLIIIDNRNIKVYNRSPNKIKGAVRVELSKLGEFMENTPKSTNLIFYCSDHDEYLSASAALRFFQKGYKNVHALKGGWEDWLKAGYPVEEK
jgi:rhodanese-related sulfurtransferase